MITAKEARELVTNWNPEGPFIKTELGKISDVIKERAELGFIEAEIDISQYSRNVFKTLKDKLTEAGFDLVYNDDKHFYERTMKIWWGQ